MAKSPLASHSVKLNRPIAQPGRQLKGRLRAGEVLLGGMIAEYVRPSLVKLYSHAGFDFVFIEYEHGFLNPTDLVDTVLCARDNGLPVIAKTPQLERAEVAKLLDCGVVGIQLPRTESRGDVETLLSYLKFPPHGTRAVAPSLGNSNYIPTGDWKSWMANQDEETTLVVHIETRVGYENAEEIISTPGVDMVYFGAGDFSIEMGHPGQYDHPNILGPQEELLMLCQKYKVPFGMTASCVESAERWIKKGTQFFEITNELSLIYQGASQEVRNYHEFIKKQAT